MENQVTITYIRLADVAFATVLKSESEGVPAKEREPYLALLCAEIGLPRNKVRDITDEGGFGPLVTKKVNVIQDGPPPEDGKFRCNHSLLT